MSTLPKGLRKKDNIKASLRQHSRGGQLQPRTVDSRESGEEMKMFSPAPSLTLRAGRQGANRKQEDPRRGQSLETRVAVPPWQ